MFAAKLTRLPRIVWAFATVVLAALFVAYAYFFTPHGAMNKLNTSELTSAPATNEPAPSDSLEPSQTTKASSTTASSKAEVASSQATTASSQEKATSSQVESTSSRTKAASSQDNATSTPPASKQESSTPSVPARSTVYSLEGNAAQSALNTPSHGALTQAIGELEDKGYTVAFVIHNMKTGNEITYNCDEELYPASSIKAAFTTCIYQLLVETGITQLEEVAPVAEPTIVESSDEGYRALHSMYGETAFIQWLQDAGVDPGSYETYENMVAWNYPHMGARKLALMWMHIYDYLTTTKSEAAQQLASFFDQREVSSLREALGTEMRTWSKMGWFESSSDYRSEPATVEAGVVFANEGPYVFSVMTTAPAELDAIIPLHEALYHLHTDLAVKTSR